MLDHPQTWRELDTIDIMKVMAIRMRGRRLRYKDLIRDNGLNSGARPCACPGIVISSRCC